MSEKPSGNMTSETATNRHQRSLLDMALELTQSDNNNNNNNATNTNSSTGFLVASKKINAPFSPDTASRVAVVNGEPGGMIGADTTDDGGPCGCNSQQQQAQQQSQAQQQQHPHRHHFRGTAGGGQSSSQQHQQHSARKAKSGLRKRKRTASPDRGTALLYGGSAGGVVNDNTTTNATAALGGGGVATTTASQQQIHRPTRRRIVGSRRKIRSFTTGRIPKTVMRIFHQVFEDVQSPQLLDFLCRLCTFSKTWRRVAESFFNKPNHINGVVSGCDHILSLQANACISSEILGPATNTTAGAAAAAGAAAPGGGWAPANSGTRLSPGSGGGSWLRVPSLRICNLPNSANEERIKELLMNFGEIEEVELVRIPPSSHHRNYSRNFAFATFKDVAGAQRLVSHPEAIVLDGRTLVLRSLSGNLCIIPGMNRSDRGAPGGVVSAQRSGTGYSSLVQPATSASPRWIAAPSWSVTTNRSIDGDEPND